jgi:hypothetical protein
MLQTRSHPRLCTTSIIRERNDSYDGFRFFLANPNHSGLWVLSVGYSGNYGFTIFDNGVPLSSYTALVYDEIQAMTS